MKRRFIITIAIVLAITVGGIGLLQYFLFRAEQFRLIDQQIESVASLLASSDLTTIELKGFEDAADIIDDVTGGEHPNQFFLVYSRTGNLIYKSANADYLPDNIPLTPTWQTIENEGHYIRVLSIPLEKHRPGIAFSGGHHRMLQTGIILDEALVRWREVGRYVFIYSSLIIVLILLSTIILSATLLTPLRQLAAYLRFMGSRFDEKQMVKDENAIPAANLAAQLMKHKDEFGQLVVAAQSLHERVGRALKTTQVWTAQMAHEMKTPLTILQNSLEGIRSAGELEAKDKAALEAQKEVTHLNSLISGFLEWTSAENFPTTDADVHAIRLNTEVEEIAQKMLRAHPGRVKIELESDVRVFARPAFFQQAVSNLISNALKYSPAHADVRVVLRNDTLSIFDEGGGIPPDVLKNLGQPFNYGLTDRHGFGLGLAWVSTICRKYGWELRFINSGGGTEARLIFLSSL